MDFLLKVSGLAVFTSLAFTSVTAFAGMKLSEQKISVSGRAGAATLQDLKKWSSSEPNSVLAVCAEVVEIPSSYICSFKTKLDMNQALLRIAFFTGTANGYPKGSVVSSSDPALNPYKEMVSGHTLISEDIQGFHAALETAKALAKPSSQEADFYSDVVGSLRPSNSASKFVVIAVTNQSSNFEMIAGHEINHASFYLQPAYKNSSFDFWKKTVSEKDKAEIRSILGKMYNSKDDNIIVDEFQAYLIQREEKQNPLAKFIPKYKPALKKALGL